MPYKDESVRKSKHKEYSRKHYEANYSQRREELNARRQQLKTEWLEYKATLKCTKCGFDHVAALDFHHEDPSQKEYNVNRLVSDGRFKKAYKEIEKCIVLCANCHRIHHHQEKKNPAL
jgi:NADPH-dependent glutamate synthase beta subunit-like oxidoreductase